MEDTAALEAVARVARDRAYAPYSRFRVGCALEADDGTVYDGCNVENASFGLTMCAERVAAGHAIAAGRRAFVRMLIVTDASTPVAPCGACRQVLSEFAPGLDVYSVSGRGEMSHWTLNYLLPDRFEISAGGGE